jgi:hypothetical protein
MNNGNNGINYREKLFHWTGKKTAKNYEICKMITPTGKT